MERRYVVREDAADPIEMLTFRQRGNVFEVWDTHKNKIVPRGIYPKREPAERHAYKLENNWLRKNL